MKNNGWWRAASILVALVLCCTFAPAGGQPARPATRPGDVIDAVQGARGLDQALARLHAPTRNTDPLPPAESLKRFKVRQGLAVDLIAAEPVVRQPLNIQFDARGRMWVVQYVQYPFPKGLKVVEYDQYIRARFDKVPLPPPKGERGADLITIHEDADGDGVYEKVKTFVDGLNIATATLPDNDGVWVMNPPYLLFYPDKNHDDVPDGDPIVHLSGFGLEDTHSVASSLMWGPDGWIYGANGSTTTGKIKVEAAKDQATTDFLGQCIWRYHPTEHRFEIFAEGGGNTFGVEFDDRGRLYSGTNWGTYRGLHYVQGGYYIKGWGKHGPLTNPHAYGYFEHMPHTGKADRLTHTFVVYGGGLLGKDFDGKIIGPNPLQSRLDLTRMEPLGSTYKTVEETSPLSSDDGWFRPVDLKVGPEGALYIADFYENRISHVDPRDTWDRKNGRLYRLRPANWKPTAPRDLGKETSAALVNLLAHENRWVRATARRVLAARNDPAAVALLRAKLKIGSPREALESLWTLQLCGAFDDVTITEALAHRDPFVRMWAIRLLGDRRDPVPDALAVKLAELAERDPDAQVRGQLASTAKRLPVPQSLPLIDRLMRRDADEKDPFIPLLLWWALENKAISDRDSVMTIFATGEVWRSSIARGTLMQRLARRYAADGSAPSQAAVVKLLDAAPGDAERRILLAGISEAFKGQSLKGLTPELAAALSRSGDIELALRAGDAKAHAQVLEAIVKDDEQSKPQRTRYIELLGEVGRPEAVPALLRVAGSSRWHSVRRAALSALIRFDDPSIGREVAAMYGKLPMDQNVRPAAISTMVTRQTWAKSLLEAIAAGSIPKADVSAEQIERIRQFTDDKSFATLADKVFGARQTPSSDQKQQEIARAAKVLASGNGNVAKGRFLFNRNCAVCHTLFAEGAKIGPDLTPYERRDSNLLLLSIIDPSAAIREEYMSFMVKTKDKQSLVGVVAERGADSITLVDSAQQKTVIPKSQIVSEKALTTSIMPEELLSNWPDQDLRDLFAYLQAPARE